MSMSLGKIVKSNSHTDYVCQVYGQNEFDPVPDVENYALGTFVKVELGRQHSGQLIGLIYDTVLLNPDFGRLGPRLSPESELTMFTPDYLNERAVLVGITAIGRVKPDGEVFQGVPLLAANNDAQVIQMTEEEIRYFHIDEDGINLAYLPLLIGMDNPLAYHIGWIVLKMLAKLLPEYQESLAVLSDDLLWRTQIGPLGGI